MTDLAGLAARADQLAAARQPVESAWRDITRFVMPTGPDIETGAAPGINAWESAAPKSAERGRALYDVTAIVAADRLTNAMESLVTPRSEKWHGLSLSGGESELDNGEADEYFETLTDRLFQMRSDPVSGFTRAHQKALRSAVTLGTGVYYVDEGFGRPGLGEGSLPLRYVHVPLGQCFMAADRWGRTDTLFRRYYESARNIAAMAKARGGRPSAQVLEAANDPKRAETRFEMVHAVYPRGDFGRISGLGSDAPFASVYFEKAAMHKISESGYRRFRYVTYHWSQSGTLPYGESPFHLALAEIKSLNLMAKNADEAGLLWVRPPLGTAHDKSMGRPNLNPGKITVGAIDKNGRQKIQALRTLENPSFAQGVLEAKRRDLKELTYMNLFQVLLERPVETAAAVLLRAKEKAELVGPIGARIQEGLAHLLDVEFDILERKGLFVPGEELAPPESLSGRNFAIRFTSPLDRERRAGEMLAARELKEEAVEWARAGRPEALERIDVDAYMDLAREIKGAPSKLYYREDELAQMREERRAAEALGALGEGGLSQMLAAAASAAGQDGAAGVIPEPGDVPDPPMDEAALAEGMAALANAEAAGDEPAGAAS